MTKIFRNPRTSLTPLIKKLIRQRKQDAIWMERFLDQQYIPLNLQVLKSSCTDFKPSNPLCRCCRFYSTHIQEVKLGRTCEIWQTAFGRNLKETIVRMAHERVKIDLHFMSIWKARKILMPAYAPVKTQLSHSAFNRVERQFNRQPKQRVKPAGVYLPVQVIH